MTISSSLNAGVMGLATNASRLATISDNIANSATVGYKQSEVDFSSMVLAQNNNGYAAGGVSATAYKNIEAEGGLIGTGNATDIAISGRGMMPITDLSGLTATGANRPLMLTPTASFSIDKDGFMATQNGQYLMGWPADLDGTVPQFSRTSASGLEPVNVLSAKLAASPTSEISLGMNLPYSATEAGGSGDPYPVTADYFTSLGSSESLSFTFTPTIPTAGNPNSNTWTVNVLDSATSPTVPIADFTIDFNTGITDAGTVNSVTGGAGATYDAATGYVSVTTANGPIDLFVGRPDSRNGITQFDAGFTPSAVTKNGAPISDLNSVEITEEGMLQAVYESGLRRTLYQIPVADVPNMNGLAAVDGQAYQLTKDSGALYLWDSGTGSVGSTTGYSLMESTTDIAAELTDLIETQRAYSTNAKIVQTVDEMLQETTNLKR